MKPQVVMRPHDFGSTTEEIEVEDRPILNAIIGVD